MTNKRVLAGRISDLCEEYGIETVVEHSDGPSAKLVIGNVSVIYAFPFTDVAVFGANGRIKRTRSFGMGQWRTAKVCIVNALLSQDEEETN